MGWFEQLASSDLQLFHEGIPSTTKCRFRSEDRMKQLLIVAGLAIYSFVMQPGSSALAAKLKTTPELSTAPFVKKKPPVLRTHCNGTCMCTGDDCTQTWQDNHCSDTPVCSMAGTGSKICSCSKKTNN